MVYGNNDALKLALKNAQNFDQQQIKAGIRAAQNFDPQQFQAGVKAAQDFDPQQLQANIKTIENMDLAPTIAAAESIKRVDVRPVIRSLRRIEGATYTDNELEEVVDPLIKQAEGTPTTATDRPEPAANPDQATSLLPDDWVENFISVCSKVSVDGRFVFVVIIAYLAVVGQYYPDIAGALAEPQNASISEEQMRMFCRHVGYMYTVLSAITIEDSES